MAKNNSLVTPSLNTDIRPQDDFFNYVNSNWLKDNPIPKSETRWGTFNILREEAWLAMRSLFEALQTGTPEPNTVEQQAKDFYFTGIHFDELKETHLARLTAFFNEIDAIADTKELSGLVGRLHSFGLNGPWYPYVGADHDDSSKHILHFYQSGLTLPDRDYYLDDSEKMKEIRSAYKAHIGKVCEALPGLAENATRLREAVIEFETDIARASRSSSDLRDVEKNFNKTTFNDLLSRYSSIDWHAYAQNLGWQADDKISVDQPEFLAFVNDSFLKQPLSSWKLYLKWRIASKLFNKISEDFALLHFEFFGKVLGGADEIMPLWKRTTLAAENAIGDATGQLYVKNHFPESSKQQVLAMVTAIRKSYGERIDKLDWMSDDTKTYAKKKLENIKVLIGYPDKWRDFRGLRIGRNSYIDNILSAQAFDVAYWLGQLHQPTSRDEWLMTPQTVNAYHDPNRLVICFPAAILQAPFFHPDAPPAANFGGIGMVIGHELTHGFDDKGGMYDAEGNVRTWQTKKERATFQSKAEVIVKQADSFHVLPDLTLRGKLVLGESIADLGGIELALHALKKQGSPTPEELRKFFINYAFSECSAVRDEKLREFALSDPHPNSEFRVNGILQHVDDFHDTFNIAPTDKLYRHPEKRVKIW